MSTYQDLLAQKAELEKQRAQLELELSESRRAARSEVIAQVKALMAEHQLTLADLGGTAGSNSVGRTSKSASGKRKVAAKYRNAATGESWSGRGIMPKWLERSLAEGKTREDFAV